MKPIKVTQQTKDELLKKFMEELSNTRPGIATDSFTFKLTSPIDKEKVTVPELYMTAEAWAKMKIIVECSSEEVAWHGTVEKYDSHKYLISDVELYPQTVTGVTVVTDDEKYATWCAKMPAAKMNKIRFQGHSHVNMGTTPSGTDTTYYDQLLQIIPDDDFYIFCIYNKRGDSTWIVYDMAQNIVFEDKDLKHPKLVDKKGNVLAEQIKTDIEKYVEKPKTTCTNPNTGMVTHYFNNERYNSKNGANATTTTTKKKEKEYATGKERKSNIHLFTAQLLHKFPGGDFKMCPTCGDYSFQMQRKYCPTCQDTMLRIPKQDLLSPGANTGRLLPTDDDDIATYYDQMYGMGGFYR